VYKQRLVALDVGMGALCGRPIPSAKVRLTSAVVLVLIIAFDVQKSANSVLGSFAESVPSLVGAPHRSVNAKRKCNLRKIIIKDDVEFVKISHPYLPEGPFGNGGCRVINGEFLHEGIMK
jgi:hypothetical protein